MTHMEACAYDDVIAAADPAPHTTVVKLAAAAGILERGTVLSGAPGGNLAPLAAAAADGAAVYVLAEDVEAPGDGQTAVAYKSGCLARNRLKCAEGYALAPADIEALRQGGILTADVAEAAE